MMRGLWADDAPIAPWEWRGQELRGELCDALKGN